ncbi:MAG: hypothetical protein V2B18_24605 [Pseudomonadota bacterium]
MVCLAEQAEKLIPRGAPIFSEKTLCPTPTDADRLAFAGGEGLVFVMHKWEYHRGIHTLRAIADSGRIGSIEQVTCVRHGWRPPHREGDVLEYWAVHDLTIVRHILNTIPSPVFSLIRCDQGMPSGLWAVLGEGPRALLSVDWHHPMHQRSVCIKGTKGTAALETSHADHILIRDHSGEEHVPFDNIMPLYAELKEFVDYLQGGPPPRCGLEHAREAAIALDALRRADRSSIIGSVV